VIERRGGGQGKGERRQTGKQENTKKGVRVNPKDKTRYQVWNSHEGRWVDKGKGWNPNPITNFEIAKQQESTQYGYQAAKVIVVGAAMVATVLTGGVFGVFGAGGGAAAGAAAEGSATQGAALATAAVGP